MENFFLGINAITNDIKVFINDMAHNKSLMGFLVGIFIATFITSFVLTKNPKHVPLILRYSAITSFEKISKRNKNGTYEMAFTKFLKMYTQIRTIFMISIIMFFVMITTISLTQ